MLINTLAVAVPTSHHWPMGDEGKRAMLQGGVAGPPELELIQSHMAQKPMLRGEVGARALRVDDALGLPWCRSTRSCVAHSRLNSLISATASGIVQRLRRRAPSHFQGLYEVWHGVGCQVRRQAGHGAAHSLAT